MCLCVLYMVYYQCHVDRITELITLTAGLVSSHARRLMSLGRAGCRIVTRPFSGRVGSGNETSCLQHSSVPARCRMKVALRHTYCHKWHCNNGRRTRPSLGYEGKRSCVTLRKKKEWKYIYSPSLTLKLTVTLSPNHWTTSNFGWLCTQFRLKCIVETSCMCRIDLRMRCTMYDVMRLLLCT